MPLPVLDGRGGEEEDQDEEIKPDPQERGGREVCDTGNFVMFTFTGGSVAKDPDGKIAKWTLFRVKKQTPFQRTKGTYNMGMRVDAVPGKSEEWPEGTRPTSPASQSTGGKMQERQGTTTKRGAKPRGVTRGDCDENGWGKPRARKLYFSRVQLLSYSFAF